MKTLLLANEYPSLTHLVKEDRHLFKNLLKGDAHFRYASGLRIMPVDLNAKVMCHGFVIEHHQLIRSATSGQYYLVFWPVLRTWQYSFYVFSESKAQKGYICLNRYHDMMIQHLIPGSNVMISTFE